MEKKDDTSSDSMIQNLALLDIQWVDLVARSGVCYYTSQQNKMTNDLGRYH